MTARIRKTHLNFTKANEIRYDLIVAGVQKHCYAKTDEEAIAIFNAIDGEKTEIKPLQGLATEYIDL